MFKGIKRYFLRFEKITWLQMAFRFMQMILAIAVIGLYAQDLNKAQKEGKYSDGKWVFATVVAAMASFTALLYIIVLLMAHEYSTTLLWAWDLILFILWVSVFGIFGGLYIKATSAYDPGIKRMKAAVWVDLTNVILWLVSGVYSMYIFFSQKGKEDLHSHWKGRKELRRGAELEDRAQEGRIQYI